MKRAVSKRNFPLAPLTRWAWPLLAALWVVLLLVGFLGSSHQQPPDNPVPWWVMVLFGTALVPAGLLSTLAHREIHIDGDRLVIAAALVFVRKVPIHDLVLDKARVLNLDERTEFRPALQLFGFGLPGFKAGHYVLRNRSRAFCLLTRRQQVLLLPQRDGKLILVSPEKPQALLDALRETKI
ncbi:MAG: hypothetical protein EOP93_07625 [Lysobacteraceae bacterium]|nr:MAG: hypothetical protein EOP93_07625 [Xanthomonadaceae bacterium]